MREFDLMPIVDLFDKEFLNGDFWGVMPPMPKEFKPFMGHMKTDIKELENEYLVEIDLPGYKKEEISIEIKDGVLTVSAKRDEEKADNKEDDKDYIRKERYVSSCSRKMTLPENVDEDAIKAKLEDGVLRLNIPKVTPTEPETPPVKSVNID